MPASIHRVENVGDKRAVVMYGKQPNTNGSGYGCHVLNSNEKAFPNWQIGTSEEDSLQVHTKGKGRRTWVIYENKNSPELHFSVSRDGGKLHGVGSLRVWQQDQKFNLWVCSNSLVIESHRPNSFFNTITDEEITGSYDPLTLLRCT